MVKVSELHFNREVFPLRLIDLPATLGSRGGVRFCLPDDWSFHVISHTWSQDVANLSVAVGKIVSESGWRKDEEDLHVRALSYNQAFAKPQFAGQSSYEKLVDVFRVLTGDGASKVWFDALCINQTDDDEKSWEIGHMGAYYRLSAGCYVITHGIGSETGFKAVKAHEPLPRWLTRAWTIQESILPEKLSFIVEKFDAETIESLKSEYPYQPGYLEGWIDWDEELEPSARGDNSRRRAYKEVYCLGAQAYMRMMQAALFCTAAYWVQFRTAFGGLEDGIAEIDVELLVRMIQSRDCSVEEDRVLCILGLLGITGDHQLRTKQTLDWQLVGLAKMLMKDNPKLLVNLCAADFEGYATPCISWLPDFRRAQHRRFAPFTHDKNYVVERYEASVKEVKEDGRVVMRARALRGSLRKEWKRYSLHVGALVIELQHQFSPQTHVHLLPLEKLETNDGPNRSLQRNGGLSIQAHDIHKLHYEFGDYSIAICGVTLLLLGHSHLSERPLALAMACVMDDDQEMHKIGILRFSSLDVEHVFPSSSEDCLIGGFGDDLTCCLSEECRTLLRPPILTHPKNILEAHPGHIGRISAEVSQEEPKVVENTCKCFIG